VVPPIPPTLGVMDIGAGVVATMEESTVAEDTSGFVGLGVTEGIAFVIDK